MIKFIHIEKEHVPHEQNTREFYGTLKFTARESILALRTYNAIFGMKSD